MSTAERRTWPAVTLAGAGAALSLPAGVVAVGAIEGGLAALLAVALVVVYRAHRFVHFGHAALGALAGSGAAYLSSGAGWNFWLAATTALAAGALIGVASGMLLAERLARASRVLVVVASVGLAFVFASLHLGIALARGAVLRMDVPIPLTLDVFPVRLSGAHVLAVTAVAVMLLAAWALLQHSTTGLRVRALAGDDVSAQRLGVDPVRTWRVLWAFAGALAAAGGIAGQPLTGTSFASGPFVGPLLLALAAAVLGGMRSLPLTVAGAVALGVVRQAVAWRVELAQAADLVLVAVIVLALLARRGVELGEVSEPSRWRFATALRPSALGGSRVARAVTGLVAAGVVAGAIVAVQLVGVGDAQRIGTIGVFALGAVSLHVTAAYGGRLSLAHWAIVGVGCVLAGAAGAGVTGLLAAVLGGAAAAVALALVERRSGALAYVTATFAAAAAFAVAWGRLQPGLSAPTSLGPLRADDPRSASVVILVVLGLVVIAVALFRRSSAGVRALAVRQDVRLAAIHGIAIGRTTAAVEALAGGIAGLAGYLYLWNQVVPHPEAFEPVRSLELLATAVLGGIGSPIGAVLGAVVVHGAQLLVEGPLALLGTGVGVFVVVVWLRGGLVSIPGAFSGSRVAQAPSALPPSPGRAAALHDAPPEETRRARRYPAVGRAGSTALAAGATVGLLLPAAVHGRSAHVAMWLVAGIGAVFVAGLAAGFRSPVWTAPAIGAAPAAGIAAVWPETAPVAAFLVGWVSGALMRRAAAAAPGPLRPAASGWTGVQAGAGVVAGVVAVGIFAVPSSWAIVAGALLAGLAWRRPDDAALRASLQRPAHDGVRVRGLVVDVDDERIIDGFDLDVPPGRVVGVAGANGVGKTTLLRCIAAELRPSAGSVTAGGIDVSASAPAELARAGVLLVDARQGSIGSLTVGENLALVGGGQRTSPTQRARELTALVHARLADNEDVPAASLSGGERRLLGLAMAIAQAPRVLLVDELARGLAEPQTRLLHAALRELAATGCAVVVVEHRPEFLEGVADEVVRMQAPPREAPRTVTARAAT